jgi:protein-S-isoprenylcysteine O-methyltransferase Ste14
MEIVILRRYLELKILPAVLVVLWLVSMWLIAQAMPWAIVSIPGGGIVASIACLLGFVAIIVSAIALHAAKTTINPFAPDATTSIVTSGIYRFSRNPIYVGLLAILAGWAIFLANVFSALLLPLFVIYMNLFQIIPEEKVLQAKFGDAYAQYLQSVRRWL